MSVDIDFSSLPNHILRPKLIAQVNYSAASSFEEVAGIGATFKDDPTKYIKEYFLCFDLEDGYYISPATARFHYTTINNQGTVIPAATKDLTVYENYSGSGYPFPYIRQFGDHFIMIEFDATAGLPNKIYLHNGDMAAWLAVQSYDLYFTDFNVIVEPQLIADYGILRVHKTDRLTQRALADYRFMQITGGGSFNYEYEDLGKYIIGYYRYPFDIADGVSENIFLGFKDTQISAPTVENQIQELSLGTAQVNGLNGDSGDIDETTITLSLPFFGFYEIDSKYINTEIGVRYFVDILGNNCVIAIYSNGEKIDMVDCKIGYDIPFIMKGFETSNDVRMVSSNLQTNILKKYAPRIIVRQKRKISGARFDTKIRKTIGDCNGFCRFDELALNLDGGITESEYDKIQNELRGGIWLDY